MVGQGGIGCREFLKEGAEKTGALVLGFYLPQIFR